MKYHRRIQKIGSSMLVSLPKEWIVENGLEKGSMLSIDINSDNSIIIYAPREAKSKEIIIDYPSEYGDVISKEITGAYLLGYDLIIVKGRDAISYNDRELIKRAIERFVGLEIVDEDAYNIKAQFLLDENTLEPTKILQRMNSIINGMYKDTVRSFIDKNNSMLQIISRRDSEVNRQYFLLVRFIRSALQDLRLADRLNLSSIDILDYRIAANLFEGAGDSIVELAKILLNNKLDVPRELLNASSLVEKLQMLAVNALINNNRAYAIQVMNEYNSLNEIFDTIKKEGNATILNIIYILDRIARYWSDVADLVKTVKQ